MRLPVAPAPQGSTLLPSGRVLTVETNDQVPTIRFLSVFCCAAAGWAAPRQSNAVAAKASAVRSFMTFPPLGEVDELHEAGGLRRKADSPRSANGHGRPKYYTRIGWNPDCAFSERHAESQERRAPAVADRRDAGEDVDPIVQGDAFADLESVALMHPAQVGAGDRRLDD